VNAECPAQLVDKLAHFAGRDAMNIEGVSDRAITAFAERGLLNDFMDFYSLHKRVNEIKLLAGFGEKSIAALLSAVERSKTVPLANFICALGIPQIGLASAKALCRYFNGDLKKIASAKADEISVISGFGGKAAEHLEAWFNNWRNADLIRRALETFTFIKSEAPIGVKSLKDKTFVTTGSLTAFKNRKELTDLIESLDGRTAGAVSSSTSFLINNDSASGSAKNKKARELGVPIITEQEFIDRFVPASPDGRTV
jgi:DNA ligase (NAD+)